MATEVIIETKIAASPADVWKVLTDYAAYPDWNPVIGDVSGDIRTGGKGKMKLNIGPGVKVDIKFVRVEQDQELCWRGGVDPIFSGQHYFRLESVDKGKATRFIHGEKFSGVLAKLLWPLMSSKLDDMYTELNDALKSRAEG